MNMHTKYNGLDGAVINEIAERSKMSTSVRVEGCIVTEGWKRFVENLTTDLQNLRSWLCTRHCVIFGVKFLLVIFSTRPGRHRCYLLAKKVLVYVDSHFSWENKQIGRTWFAGR
jgi:hypothetical protein